MQDTAIIRADGVSKYYGQNLALDQVSLAVQKSEVVALLGANGAGKTTLINLCIGSHQSKSW